MKKTFLEVLFYPAKRRLTDKEATSIVFDYDINTNVFCLLRIS